MTDSGDGEQRDRESGQRVSLAEQARRLGRESGPLVAFLRMLAEAVQDLLGLIARAKVVLGLLIVALALLVVLLVVGLIVLVLSL